MAKKSNLDLKRVNINLPNNLVERVKEYAEDLGINTTSAYIFLLNQALNQNSQIQSLPVMIDMYNQIMSNPKLIETLSNQDND